MIGIVLEGGGAKGAYQVGVWRCLSENNIKYGCVVGTSIGACNGAAMVMNDYSNLENIWFDFPYEKLLKEKEKRMESLSNSNYSNNFSKTELDINKTKEQFLNNHDGIDVKFLLDIFDKFIDENAIRESNIDFGLVTYNLTNDRLEERYKMDIPKGKLGEYLMASSFLPSFKPFKINGDYYLDGGFFNNLPINMLLNKGYKDILSIRLRPERYDYSSFKGVEGLNIIDISPEESLGGTLQFEKENIKKNIELGYFDAQKKLKGLKVI
jgi:NTE family protein